MAATPYQNVTIPSNISVTNTAPIVSNVALPSPINLLAGTTTQVNCTAQVIDDNGVSDLNITNATLHHSSVAPTAPDSNETKYSVVCSCYGMDNITSNCTCSFDVWYYANNGTWYCNVTVVDDSSESDTVVNSTIINTLRAVNVTRTSLDYGDLPTGNTSQELNITLINIGNTIIDISAFAYGSAMDDGLAMVCDGGSIDATYERYDYSSGTEYALMTSVSGNSAAPSQMDLDIGKREDGEEMGDASSMVYWKLQIPVGAGGVCNGTLTFIAEADT